MKTKEIKIDESVEFIGFKVYCKDCKYLHTFERFYCDKVKETGGYSREYLNKNNNCKYYEMAR